MYRNKKVEKYIINKSKDKDNIKDIRANMCVQSRNQSNYSCHTIAGLTAVHREDGSGCSECDCFYAVYNEYNNLDRFIETLIEDNIISKTDAFRYSIHVD